MAISDVDLRNGAAAGALHHLLAALGLEVDADLLDHLDTLGLEQPLGHDAVRAHTGGIHHHAGHDVYFSTGGADFSSGGLACCQAPMPPFSCRALLKPDLRSSLSAAPLRGPERSI